MQDLLLALPASITSLSFDPEARTPSGILLSTATGTEVDEALELIFDVKRDGRGLGKLDRVKLKRMGIFEAEDCFGEDEEAGKG